MKVTLLPLVLTGLFCTTAHAQFEPESAQVDLYFPQLADGGTSFQQWQTSFVFFNANATTQATATINLFDNNGNPLSLDFGSGATSTFSLPIPPLGTRTLRSTGASSSIVTGWATGVASLPLQATVLFRELHNGVPLFEVAAPSTVPSTRFRSPANRFLGIALANIYNVGESIQVTALDSEGRQMASAPVQLGPLGHTAFNLYSIFPTLPSGFTGSIDLSTYSTNPNYEFVAWTLNSDGSGVISSLPPGGLGWPISHWDRIQFVWAKVLNAGVTFAANIGVDLSSQPVTLQISYGQVLNARGGANGVTVWLALSELISDSPSELAAVLGHELGHVMQYRRAGPGTTVVPIFYPVSSTYAGLETDADEIGTALLLEAGFDPYAGAGALAKLAMATGQASPLSQAITDYDFQANSDPHPSYGTRIELMFQLLTNICSNPTYSASCSTYKNQIHPHFPSQTPLSVRQPN